MKTLRFETITHADRATAWDVRLAPATYETWTTAIAVEMDVTPGFEEHVNDTWPRASARLEAICEATL